MSESATRSPITLSQTSAVGLIDWAWTDSTALATSNDDYAVAEGVGAGVSTSTLHVTGFGSFGIPEGATIVGVRDEVECRSSVDGPLVIVASILVGDESVGQNLASPPIDMAEEDTVVTFGGETDLWGTGPLSRTDVEGEGFGLALQIKNDGGAEADIYIDHVRRTVWWTETEEETMGVTAPTTAEVIEEGQFKRSYFPRTANNQALMDSMIQARINDSASYLRLRMGSTGYSAATGDTADQAKTAILYLTCSKLWQQVKNVMDAYDEETLPPEFVEPDQAAANRDYYRDMALEILGLIDTDPNDALTGFRRPYFNTAGASNDTPAMLDAWLEML